MTIIEFQKKHLLSFKVDDMHSDKIEFTLNTIERTSLKESLIYKRLRAEVPVEWLRDKIEEEINAGRNPGKFQDSFYDNQKRKLINTLLLKNNIKGVDAMDLSTDVNSLFK